MLSLNEIEENCDSIIPNHCPIAKAYVSWGEFLCLPGGLHLARGLGVLKHLDDGLRLLLELLQLCHHCGPLLLQGCKITCSLSLHQRK